MNDTIAAISTTVGIGAISIVRMSGVDALLIASKIYKGIDLLNAKSNTINYGHIVDNDEVIDEVMVSIMKGPKSYTCEDIVEINCHGGIATTNKVLELCLLNGARLAEPGEFTKRAFLNGRIDLVEAESVMDLINGNSDKVRKVAINGVDGLVSNTIKILRNDIASLLASIEVDIDYPEYEDNPEISYDFLIKKLNDINTNLNDIIKNSENGMIIKNGIKTVIVGKPNVGKSSILNRLLRTNKAIVTNIAGTTRDIVEGSITIEGVSLDIIDTAGIRQTEDIIEKIGVEKSLKLIDEADLILVVIDSSNNLDDYDKELIDKVKNKKSIIVLNKSDLENNINMEIEGYNVVHTNTVTDRGIDELKSKIVELFNLGELDKNDYISLSNIRQITLAKKSKKCIDNALISAKNNTPIDLVEIDIKNAWDNLGLIIGESYDEELLDKLFSQFCVGK